MQLDMTPIVNQG